MPRFTFKLEGVLEQRQHAELQRQREVAFAQQKLLKLQAELDAMSAVSRNSAAELRSPKFLSAVALISHQRFAAAMRQKGAALRRQRAEAERELAEAQASLTEAAKQRKVMEKLREREHAKWQEQERRRELADADEISQQIAHAGRFDSGV